MCRISSILLIKNLSRSAKFCSTGTQAAFMNVKQLTDTGHRVAPHSFLRSAPFTAHSRSRRFITLTIHSQGNNGSDVEQKTAEADADARLEELERGRRRRAPQRSQRREKISETTPSNGGFAEWREGELFPRGWEDMGVGQKASELWAGKRGAMFWANKAAWASVFVIGGAWFLFRVVGPVLGLYTLKNDLLSPPNL